MEQNQTIGTLLKEWREKKNISLEEISQITKINLKVLKALENDELRSLPNKTYVKGFVANYARAVGLDENEAKSSLENTYAVKLGHIENELSPAKKNTLGALQADNPKEDESEEIKETVISIAQSFFNKKIIYGLIAIGISFVIIKAVVNFFTQLNFESQSIANKAETVEEKISEAKEIKTAEANILEMDGNKKFAKEVLTEKKKETQKTEEILPQVSPPEEVKETVPVKAEAKPEEKKEEKKVVNLNGKFPYKKFSPAPLNMFTIVENSPEAGNIELLPERVKNKLDPEKQNVYIVATENDTWIGYKIDENKIKRYVLKKGKRTFLQGNRILLFMGNFNATKIFYNNYLLDAKTKTGVKSLIFPQDLAKNYELPLFPSYKGVPYSAEEYKANMATKEESSTN